MVIEVRKKISKMSKEIQQNPEHRAKYFGKNHYNWQGGISFGSYSQDFISFIKEQVRQRDNYSCQLCGKLQSNCGRKLDIHHINYDKKNSNTDNLISLCRSCHMKTNNISSRELWKDKIWTISHYI